MALQGEKAHHRPGLLRHQNLVLPAGEKAAYIPGGIALYLLGVENGPQHLHKQPADGGLVPGGGHAQYSVHDSRSFWMFPPVYREKYPLARGSFPVRPSRVRRKANGPPRFFSFFRQEQASGRRARPKSPDTAQKRGHKPAVSRKVKAR